jgi:hypothetical protein
VPFQSLRSGFSPERGIGARHKSQGCIAGASFADIRGWDLHADALTSGGVDARQLAPRARHLYVIRANP